MDRYEPHQIGLYARVSTDRQAKEKEGSLKSQVQRCKKYLEVAGYNALPLESVHVFREEGVSGCTLDRPEFHRLMRSVRKGQIKLILFTELSRVSRSVGDFLGLTVEWGALGVEFVSLREQFDSTSPSGRMMMTVLMALNQFEREQTSLRTKLNMRARAERGLYNGGGRVLGYQPDGERKGNLLVVEEEAPIIRAVFETYIETGSVPETVRRLTAAGYQRPAYESSRGHKHPARPFKWDAVRGILANPTYTGLKEINRCNRGLSDEEMALLPEDERYRTVKAVWDPIIDRDTFDKAAQVIVENGSTNHNSVKRRKHDFVLTGVVHCSGCGLPLQGATAKAGRFAYYQHRKGTHGPHCPKRRWTATEVEDAILNRLSKLADDERLLDDIIANANQRLNRDSPLLAEELRLARMHHTRLQDEASVLVQQLTSNSDKLPAFFYEAAQQKQEAMDASQRKIHQLERQIEELHTCRLEAASYRAALKDFKTLFKTMNPHDQRNLVHYLIERIELDEEGEVRMWMGCGSSIERRAAAAKNLTGQSLRGAGRV